MTVLIAGGTEADSAALPTERWVRRVGTLAEAREALPEVNLVVASEGFDPGVDTLLGVVRSGVHCPSDTPVVRLVEGPADGPLDLDAPPRRQSDFDAVVPAGDEEAVRTALTLGDRTERYRDAVADLYEACRARAAGEDVDIGDVSDRATEAFEDVRDAAGRTPYEQLLGRSDEALERDEPVPDSTPEEGEATGDEAG